MHNHSVSIIIPCHNDGDYLCDAIASALGQTYNYCEIIIIDDHSTDPTTIAILEQLQCHGYTVIHTQAHQRGPAAARNAGIAASTGRYILPLDADDIIAPDYVARSVDVLKNDSAILICYCNAVLFGKVSGPWELEAYSFIGLLCSNCIFSTALFRHEDWVRVGGYDEQLTLGFEDWAFWIAVLADGGDVYKIDADLFNYRVKHHSRSTQVRGRGLYKAVLAVIRSQRSVYLRNSIPYMRAQCKRLFTRKVYPWFKHFFHSKTVHGNP